MKKGIVMTMMMLSLVLQPVVAYADTAVPAATPAVSDSTQLSPVPTSPAALPTSGSADGTALPSILDANGKPVNPGTLPDSPLYWLSNLIQKIQVFFTFDPVKKAELIENQALQSLAAAREMAEKGKPELAQKALGAYTDKVQQAQKFLEEVKDPNSTTAQTLQKAMAQVDAKNIQVLSGLLDKLPPQAAEKLAVNIVRSMEKAVAKMTEEEKKQVKSQWQEASKHVKPENLDAQAADALAKFQASLGLKGGKSAMAQDGGNADVQSGNNDGNNNDGNHEGDNTVLLNEDPNQPLHTIGEEKKAAADGKAREQEQKQEQNKNREQEQNKNKEQDKNKEQEKNKVKQQEQEREQEQDIEESGHSKQPAVQSSAVSSQAGQGQAVSPGAGNRKSDSHDQEGD